MKGESNLFCRKSKVMLTYYTSYIWLKISVQYIFKPHYKVAVSKIVCNNAWKFAWNGVGVQVREKNTRLQCVVSWSTEPMSSPTPSINTHTHRHAHLYSFIQCSQILKTIQKALLWRRHCCSLSVVEDTKNQWEKIPGITKFAVW